MHARAAVPEALLVTGFLGAGKTTFIREQLVPHLAAARRFAVLVNDFGDVGFDGPLLERAGLPVIEVEGGCFCCAAGGRLLETLHRIRTALAPELLIVEGSGLADPWPLLEALHAEGFQVLGAPCLVDAAAHDRLRNDPLYQRQIDAASLLLVTKAAFAGANATDAAVRFLGERKTAAAVCVLGRDDARALSLLAGEPFAPPAARPPRVRSPAERAWTWRPAGLPSLAQLLAHLQDEPDVYRVKGVCQFQESATPIALNWAFGQASTMPLPQPKPGALTFLGPAAGPHLAARLPACAPWEAGDIEREVALPAGAFDARPGIGHVGGRAVPELDAAEALLDFCADPDVPTGLVADIALADVLAEASGAMRRLVPVVLTDHRYATLVAAAARLERTGARRALVLTRAASAEVIASRFGASRAATFTPAYCLQAPAVALRGLNPQRAAALLSALGKTRSAGRQHYTFRGDSPGNAQRLT